MGRKKKKKQRLCLRVSVLNITMYCFLFFVVGSATTIQGFVLYNWIFGDSVNGSSEYHGLSVIV